MEEVLQDDDQVLVHHKVAVQKEVHNHAVVHEVVHVEVHEAVHEVDHEVGHEVDHVVVHEVGQVDLEDVVQDVDEAGLVGRMLDSHVVLVLQEVLEVVLEVVLHVQEVGHLDHP